VRADGEEGSQGSAQAKTVDRLALPDRIPPDAPQSADRGGRPRQIRSWKAIRCGGGGGGGGGGDHAGLDGLLIRCGQRLLSKFTQPCSTSRIDPSRSKCATEVKEW